MDNPELGICLPDSSTQIYSRASTRKDRSIIELSKSHIIYLQEYTGQHGLTREKLTELIDSYNNVCIILLEILCQSQNPPYKPPASIKIFFQSIRKAVCPAISITPTELWGDISFYLSNSNGDGINSLVSTMPFNLLIFR